MPNHNDGIGELSGNNLQMAWGERSTIARSKNSGEWLQRQPWLRLLIEWLRLDPWALVWDYLPLPPSPASAIDFLFQEPDSQVPPDVSPNYKQQIIVKMAKQ